MNQSFLYRGLLIQSFLPNNFQYLLQYYTVELFTDRMGAVAVSGTDIIVPVLAVLALVDGVVLHPLRHVWPALRADAQDVQRLVQVHLHNTTRHVSVK